MKIANAVVITAGLLLGLCVRLYASSEATAVVGPTHLRHGPDGLVYAAVADQLMVFSPEGALRERIPLSRLGLDRIVGDFWVSRDGEILLRAQRPESGMARTLRVLFRIGGDDGDQATPGETVLQWCTPADGQCRPFAPSFRSLRTFRLWQEGASGAVLVADTAQHRLLRFSAAGELEAVTARDFKFPNAMQMGRDGLLYVTDTNHHLVAGVDPSAVSFGEVRGGFSVAMDASRRRQTWPMSIVQAEDAAFWVINAGPDMAYGEVAIYEADGRFRRALDLAPNADPLSLLAQPDRVLVADPRRFEINAYDLEGSFLYSFGDSDFFNEMDELRRRKAFHERMSEMALYVIIGLFGLLLVFYRAAAAKRTQSE